jgi:hypothetical protein
MPKHPLKPAEIRPPFIKPDADFDVWIGASEAAVTTASWSLKRPFYPLSCFLFSCVILRIVGGFWYESLS